jgi:chromosome segregation ATPase
MRIEIFRKLAGTILVAILACAPVRARQQTSQQSGSGDAVAEAARKSREQKKDAPKPKKVLTEDDLSGKTGGISTVGQENAQPGSGAASSASSQAPAGALTPEQLWRKRFADHRAKIARAQQELDVLQREENKAEVQYYSDPTKAMKEQLTRNEINTKATKIDAKKKEIASLQQQLDDLEQQLRKAGGDPGWAR